MHNNRIYIMKTCFYILKTFLLNIKRSRRSTAVTLVAEIRQFSRFSSARHQMSYTGLRSQRVF
ncbi:MAG: transposase [Bacillota bacterium]